MEEIKANKQNLEHLLERTKTIVQHHKEITEAKGEHFNLFSVLNIETRENKTHSAFLAELLNPKGSHKQEEKFLKLFLQVVGKELTEENAVEDLTGKFINTTKTTVTTEFSIGKRNDKDKEGGRLDILIKNGNYFICIENKIYAHDQKAQIERYWNYNSKSNSVFYLTLKGEDPHQDSKGELESGEHFFNISYRDHITEWLELCLREVPNLTSVREAINQYILLIKKLTNTLHMEQKQKLESLMAKYIEESAYISSNYEQMTEDFKENFRSDVKEKLKKLLDAKYRVSEGKPVSKKYSQLWIHFKKHPNLDFKFGLESFSGNGHGYLFVGIRDPNKSEILTSITEEHKINSGWRHTQNILTEDGNPINLNHMYTLKILAKPKSDEYQNLVNWVVNQSIEFIKDYEPIIFKELAREEAKGEKVTS